MLHHLRLSLPLHPGQSGARPEPRVMRSWLSLVYAGFPRGSKNFSYIHFLSTHINFLLIWISIITSTSSTSMLGFISCPPKNKHVFFSSLDDVSKRQIITVTQNIPHWNSKKCYTKFWFPTDKFTQSADRSWSPGSNPPSISLHHR